MRNKKGEYKVLRDICVPGAQWKLDSKGAPNQLKKTELILIAKGWLDFIQHSIIHTSNHFEVTVDRAVLSHSIMTGKEVRVENLIPTHVQAMAQSEDSRAKLIFSSIIDHFCQATRVSIEEDTHIKLARNYKKDSHNIIRIRVFEYS
ncbi:uncharacterized protein DS421_13g406580 [Arachis hypogaea]|nr:uncharacterized protein DS421_13g406580 [Arachis hypogaea]